MMLFDRDGLGPSQPGSAGAAHLRVRPQCGICSAIFSAGADCVGMLGNEASDRVAFLTDLFPFPRYGPVFVNGWRLCTYPNCDYCTSKPESVILHHDCFKTFVRHVLASNAANPSSPRAVMDRLWRFTAARVPWKDVPDLFLEDDDLSTLDRATVGAVATGHDMPLLQVLPPELVEMVKQRSEDTVFWRITSAVDLANRLADAPVDPAPARTLPMDTIASWRRGEAPIVCEDAGMTASLPIVRLSIDSRGLKSIERYPADSHITSSPRRASSMVFVVEPHTSFDSVLATYQDGLLRLIWPDKPRAMAIWDMSTPPASPLREDAPKDDTLRYVGTICSQSRLCTVRLDGITGLTFFMRNGHLVHIHRHTLKAPQARQPSSVTPHDSYDPTCWRYVPLSEADHIEAIKVDETNTGAFQITLQTKLVGTVTVGNCLAKRIIASQTIQDPSIIVYDKREPWPASMIGAYSSEGSGFPGLDAPVVVPDVRPTLQDAWPIPISGPEVYFSAAQLDAVRRATVFSQDAKCTGIVFLYENGGEAAVGRCSPGYGETREYHDPEYICVKTSSTADGRNSATYHAAVLFSKAREHTGAAPQTACCRRMSGKSLRFWYSHKSTCLELMGPEGSEALAVQ